MTDSERIDTEIGKFPEVFGLRGFPGQRFKINRSASFVSRGHVALYVFTEEGKAFCKGSPGELRRELLTFAKRGDRTRGTE